MRNLFIHHFVNIDKRCAPANLRIDNTPGGATIIKQISVTSSLFADNDVQMALYLVLSTEYSHIRTS